MIVESADVYSSSCTVVSDEEDNENDEKKDTYFENKLLIKRFSGSFMRGGAGSD